MEKLPNRGKEALKPIVDKYCKKMDLRFLSVLTIGMGIRYSKERVVTFGRITKKIKFVM